jgi:hypothetical protein
MMEEEEEEEGEGEEVKISPVYVHGVEGAHPHLLMVLSPEETYSSCPLMGGC